MRDHYGPLAKVYHEQYDPARLLTNQEYPANYFRLRILLERLAARRARRLLDVGIGEGTPAVAFAERGMEVRGFDFTPQMVELAKANFARNGLDPTHVIPGDIRRPETYRRLLADGPFDALVCAGVMPHVEDDVLALQNMRAALRPEGVAFVEFRNGLFSLFTMNRLTHDFIVEELLADAPETCRRAASERLKTQMEMDRPPRRTRSEEGGAGYDAVLSRFHNPLDIAGVFETAGFGDLRLHWYHYHPAAPYLEGDTVSREDYRRAAMALEGETSGWRGYFLCSAFVVEATAR